MDSVDDAQDERDRLAAIAAADAHAAHGEPRRPLLVVVFIVLALLSVALFTPGVMPVLDGFLVAALTWVSSTVATVWESFLSLPGGLMHLIASLS